MKEKWRRAATEINELWLNCLRRSPVHLANCPSDDEIATIIEKHFPPEDTHD